MPAILIDVILVAVLLFFTLRGAKKGFVLTLCSLVAVVVALIGANLLADALAPKVGEAIYPKIETAIQQGLEEQITRPDGEAGAAAEVLETLKDKGGIYRWAAEALESTLTEGLSETVSQLAATAASVVASQLARGLIFLVGFVLVLLAWTLLSHALNLVAKLPVLNTVNNSLGGVIGLVKGLVIVYIAVWALYTLSGTVTAETVEQTYLFRFFAEHSPMELIMMKDVVTQSVTALPEPS